LTELFYISQCWRQEYELFSGEEMTENRNTSREKNIYRKGLEKTRGTFWGRIKSVFGGRNTLEAEDLDRIEEILIAADVGMSYTAKFLEKLGRTRLPENPAQAEGLLREMLRRLIMDLIPVKQSEAHLLLERKPSLAGDPHVILVVGVNGSGKTTTIGKLAARMRKAGRSVLVVAADTYRAAAIDQLRIWAERSGALFQDAEEGADPAAVVHDALASARKSDIDTLIIDTAGRLHTKVPLMKELEKVSRVAGKVIEDAPHEVLLVLDATTGQNALVQAREFFKTSGVTGIVMAKMDGTAKGGILIPISGELDLPILYLGLGEGLDDLVPFDPAEYAKGLVG
jgi:fused signal recognition particle receptor